MFEDIENKGEKKPAVKTDWKLKEAAGRVPVYYLNTPLDFSQWHVVFRRMVVSYNMIDALMYSIPASQKGAMEARIQQVTGKMKAAPKEEVVEVDLKVLLPKIEEPAAEVPLKVEPKSMEDEVLMKSLGITSSMDVFFSATTAFINVKTGTPDTDREAYFRQEIWIWMEKSLSQGQFNWYQKP